MLKIYKKTAYIFITAFLMSPFFARPAEAFLHISDLVTDSAPGSGADHTIIFQVTENIPPSGRISIIPQSGRFFMSSGFDYEEVDFAVSDNRNGPYTERSLGESPNAAEDGVSTVPNSFNGRVDININTASGIDAGDYVRIKLGTNAVYGASGTVQILNPVTTGTRSVTVYGYDASNGLIEQGKALIAIIQPVSMNSYANKYMANGSPMGWLGYGTTQTILSVQTNFASVCRYSNASGTPFASMTGFFTNTGEYLHSVIVTGIAAGIEYSYYIRCQESVGGTSDDYMNCLYRASTTPYLDSEGEPILEVGCYEYYLKFQVQGQSGEGDGGSSSGDGDDGGGTGGGAGAGSGSSSGGGGSGGGSGGGIGRDQGRDRGSLLPYPPLPDKPGVAFTGWAYPGSEVVFLKDGQEVGAMDANSLAEFGAFLPDLNQGIYTFSIWSADSEGRKSATYSTTFWIDDGTQTVVSDIFISPTAVLSKNSANAGESVGLSGQSAPGATITAYIFPASVKDFKLTSAVKTAVGIVGSDGKWNISLNTDGLSGGYIIKAKAVNSVEKESEFSQNLDLIIGGAPEPAGACEGADLNQDGKVNLTDFSILLYHWGTADECADQNKNGKVEITDFSIMMYYWTG